MQHRIEQRIVPIGSGGVGKTAICCRIRYGHFLEDYDPTIEDNYRKQMTVDGETILPEFLDGYGQEEYSEILYQWMRMADGFFLIYSITSLASFSEIQEKYYDMILRAKDINKVPMVLIGNKSDLENQRGVTRAMGEELAKRYGIPFFETSAKTDINVTESLIALIREIRKNNPTTAPKKDKKKNECKLS